VSDVAQRLRDAADLAEQAAVYRQHAELDGPRGNPTVIGALDHAGDVLRAAAAELSSPPPYSRRVLAKAKWMIGLQVVACVATLWAAPDPAMPWVLALTFAGTGVLAKAATDILFKLRDRRAAHRFAAADPDPVVPELPAMLAQLRTLLEPLHTEHVEYARAWLDAAEYTLPTVLYRLCDKCFRTNGGLIYTRHRQVHASAHGRQSCVDERLVDIIASLWQVCETRSCCQDDDGIAYVVPTTATIDAAHEALAQLGIEAERVNGALCFPLPAAGLNG
jgi:hypothetical protein